MELEEPEPEAGERCFGGIDLVEACDVVGRHAPKVVVFLAVGRYLDPKRATTPLK